MPGVRCTISKPSGSEAIWLRHFRWIGLRRHTGILAGRSDQPRARRKKQGPAALSNRALRCSGEGRRRAGALRRLAADSFGRPYMLKVRSLAAPRLLDQFLLRADQRAEAFGQQGGVERLLERFVDARAIEVRGRAVIRQQGDQDRLAELGCCDADFGKSAALRAGRSRNRQ